MQPRKPALSEVEGRRKNATHSLPWACRRGAGRGSRRSKGNKPRRGGKDNSHTDPWRTTTHFL